MAQPRKAPAKRGAASRRRPRPEPEPTLRWYRARQALYDDKGAVIAPGGLFLAEPTDPRVLSGQAKLDGSRSPTPAEIAEALAAAEG